VLALKLTLMRDKDLNDINVLRDYIKTNCKFLSGLHAGDKVVIADQPQVL